MTKYGSLTIAEDGTASSIFAAVMYRGKHKGTVVLQQRALGGSDIYSYCENVEKNLKNPGV